MSYKKIIAILFLTSTPFAQVFAKSEKFVDFKFEAGKRSSKTPVRSSSHEYEYIGHGEYECIDCGKVVCEESGPEVYETETVYRPVRYRRPRVRTVVYEPMVYPVYPRATFALEKRIGSPFRRSGVSFGLGFSI